MVRFPFLNFGFCCGIDPILYLPTSWGKQILRIRSPPFFLNGAKGESSIDANKTKSNFRAIDTRSWRVAQRGVGLSKSDLFGVSRVTVPLTAGEVCLTGRRFIVWSWVNWIDALRSFPFRLPSFFQLCVPVGINCQSAMKVWRLLCGSWWRKLRSSRFLASIYGENRACGPVLS